MPLQTRSQKLAEMIYKQVQVVDDTRKDDYGSACMKLAPLVLGDGLMQTIAFYEVKKSKTEKGGFDSFLFDLWQCVGRKEDKSNSLHHWLVNCSDGVAYMMMTRRVLDAAIWYKRFAESLLDIDIAATNE